MKKKIESYQGAAGGWGAVKSVANAVRKQMDIRQDVIAMFDMNKPEGFDCPGCAWPDPKHSASFDICENGAKAIAWEVTDKQVNASFFAENTVQSLLTWGDHELEAAGRLTQPLKYDDVSDCYKPLSWQQAFDEIGARLQSYSDPNQVEFYTSGRTSNEAAFLYQLFAREYGSNNFPDCSNMCHEPTSVGLAASIGVGKGTVLLEDFEKCDLVICIGHNPGTNHPRMLTSLRALVKRGAKMIAINPLQERGLERFTAPQNPFEMLTNSETQLASAYYNVRIGGDMALLKGMMRLLIERDDAASAAGRPSLLDDEFIQTHTVGFDELRRDVLNSEWKDIERISGLSQTQIAELADAYAAAERTIICYGMGITQHEHGTQNVQQLVNLLLMKGNIGKPGAGICPLRGHSNVQGDRTVGITEKPSAEFLDRLCERYGFTPPHAPGHAAIASMQAICTGQARALICMGGNFALAMPDREASAVPLTQLDLAVHVATKLNRSHLLTARHSYILPVLGRSEIDMQKSGAQAVTVEDSMSMIHASRGVLKPAGVMLKSECAVVAGIAQAALPQSVVAWEYLVEDYDRIRNDIEAVLPEFADYNQRIRHPGGFHLIIDGPQELHDRYRRSNSGNGTFAKVIAAIERLKSYQIEFNTLTVINNINVHYPLEVYHFLKSIGSKHMQFIELLETGTPNIDFSGHSENTFRIIDFSVPPTAYGKFMSTIFMRWVKNDVGEIFIRQFESFVSRFLGNGHTSCIFQESCKDNLVVESNGDIYECDHFVYPQYKIGNINKSELKTMNSVQLTAQKKRISAKCQQCAYKPICNGGCPKHRITKVNNETVSYFCEGYKILFSTMVPYMNAMVELAKNRVPLYHIMDVAKQMENN